MHNDRWQTITRTEHSLYCLYTSFDVFPTIPGYKKVYPCGLQTCNAHIVRIRRLFRKKLATDSWNSSTTSAVEFFYFFQKIICVTNRERENSAIRFPGKFGVRFHEAQCHRNSARDFFFKIDTWHTELFSSTILLLWT